MPQPRTTELHICDDTGELVPAKNHLRCDCEACRLARNAYDRERRRRNGGRAGVKPTTGRQRHGILHYQRGCRCLLCVAAFDAVPCGTETKQSYGCGCEACKEVHAGKQRSRSRRKGVEAKRPRALEAKDIRTDQLGVTFMSCNGNFGAVEYDTMTREQFLAARG